MNDFKKGNIILMINQLHMQRSKANHVLDDVAREFANFLSIKNMDKSDNEYGVW